MKRKQKKLIFNIFSILKLACCSSFQIALGLGNAVEVLSREFKLLYDVEEGVVRVLTRREKNLRLTEIGKLSQMCCGFAFTCGSGSRPSSEYFACVGFCHFFAF